MHRFEPYIDLRFNRQNQTSDISLWPSFTDIMTVILMIFMLTMVIVIIKNADLARRLLAQQAQQREVQEALNAAREAESELELIVTNLEEKLRAKEMEIILLGDEISVLQSTLEAKVAFISALQSRIGDLQEDVGRLESEVAAAREEKEKLRSRFNEKMAAIREETRRQIAEFNRKFAALLERLDEKEESIVVLNAEKRELELALAKQRKAYLVLEEKYNELVRPARSPMGKTVVTVQYSKTDGRYRILFKGPDSDAFEAVERGQLHARLRRLKDALREKLYVKVIIPEDSGLSYNEAWNFTREILSKYDYYYQEYEKEE
jgi:DNA repair exonuclease SbcCD ATPase subunit